MRPPTRRQAGAERLSRFQRRQADRRRYLPRLRCSNVLRSPRALSDAVGRSPEPPEPAAWLGLFPWCRVLPATRLMPAPKSDCGAAFVEHALEPGRAVTARAAAGYAVGVTGRAGSARRLQRELVLLARRAARVICDAVILCKSERWCERPRNERGSEDEAIWLHGTQSSAATLRRVAWARV